MNLQLRRRLIFMLESDLGLIRPNGQRAHKMADANLRSWARGYLFHDRREIMSLAGNGGGSSLGRDVKRNNRDNNVYGEPVIEINDSRYRALNSVVLRLSPASQRMINLHYVDRKDESVRDYAQKLGISKRTYDRRVSEAKQEFIARGGIAN